MANAKISALPLASPLAGNEAVPVVQSGLTSKTTVDAFAARAAIVGTSIYPRRIIALAYTLVIADKSRLVTMLPSSAAPMAMTLPTPGTDFPNGWFCFVQNQESSAQLLTLTPNDARTIDGGASLILAPGEGILLVSDGTDYYTMGGNSAPLTTLHFACSDESTALTTGTGKLTFRMPHRMWLSSVKASLNVASSGGAPAVDINCNGASIFSTTLTIDAAEKTSATAATAAVLSTTFLPDDSEITIDIDTAGTGAKGLKITLVGRR